ncbi:MAG: hypothetical protein AAGC73_03870 [Verrucomicrobiota bacterium]
MIRLFYMWRYRRSQNASAFKLPKSTGERSKASPVDLGSYLSQDTVRGRHFPRFDLSRARKRWLRIGIMVLSVVLVVWLINESMTALLVLKD